MDFKKTQRVYVFIKVNVMEALLCLLLTLVLNRSSKSLGMQRNCTGAVQNKYTNKTRRVRKYNDVIKRESAFFIRDLKEDFSKALLIKNFEVYY